MTDERKQQFIDAGVEIESALERFMNNDAMLEKFLKKFLDDKNFEKLVNAMQEKEFEDAFEAAHTLKGVCGNLSLDIFCKSVCTMVEYLRSNQYDEACAYMPELTREYENAIEKVKNL